MERIFLFSAIFCEIFGTYFLKMTGGFTKPVYIPRIILAYVLGFTFFGFSLRSIDIRVAYAIWAGVGIVGTMLLGIFVFGESLNFAKTLFIGLIFIGALGLNLSFPHS